MISLYRKSTTDKYRLVSTDKAGMLHSVYIDISFKWLLYTKEHPALFITSSDGFSYETKKHHLIVRGNTYEDFCECYY